MNWVKKLFLEFVAWRVFLFVPLILSYPLIKIRQGFEYTTSLHYILLHSFLSNFLLYPWANFDGVYYLTIASAGYTVDNSGFFPLYPALIKVFSLNNSAFSPYQFFTGLILSSLFIFFGIIAFYKLLRMDFNKKTAFLAVSALLFFPTSFYLASIYPESLFFMLLIMSFYFARKGNWLLSGVCGILLTATRIVGIAIFPALLFEFYVQNKELFSKKIIPVFLSPVGLVSYFFYDYLNFGNFFQFAKAQGGLHNNRSVGEIVLFPQTLYRYFKIITSLNHSQYEWWIAILELLAFIFAALMMYIAWKKKVRISYLIFALIAFLIPTQTGTFTGLPRYVLVLFPIFIAVALIKNKYIKIIYVLVSIVLLIILFILFSKGYYVA